MKKIIIRGWFSKIGQGLAWACDTPMEDMSDSIHRCAVLTHKSESLIYERYQQKVILELNNFDSYEQLLESMYNSAALTEILIGDKFYAISARGQSEAIYE